MYHDKIAVGLIGAGFISETHVRAMRTNPDVEVLALADVDEDRGRAFTTTHGIERFYKGHKAMLEDRNIDAVVVGIPNKFHAPISLDAMDAGKHVICEKPLALTLEDAESMVAKSRETGLVLGHAEELCFVPKFLRAKEVMDAGGVGKPYLLRQCEKHAGPYSPWFWRPAEAGGGILMDMGCHSIECIRFMRDKPKVKSVYAQMNTFLHKEMGPEEDFVLILMEFEDGTLGQAEASWALKGGMDSSLEIFGTGGVIKADLLKGNALNVFSEEGFIDTWGPTQGWCYPDVEWLWNNGYPQEDKHFVDCMKSGQTPVESGEDGLAVLEIMLAAYHSAAIGQKVALPFRPRGIPYPIDLWLNPRPELGAGPVLG